MHTRPLLSFVLAILVSSCASSPDLTRTRFALGTSPYPELARGIDALLPDSLFPPSGAGIMVYSLTRREPLYSLNPDLLFTPASNQKLMTAAAALDLLGAGYGLRTDCFVIGDSAIVVRGGGNPLLRTADIDSMARVLAPSLARDRAVRISADLSLFDTVQLGRGWMWDDDPGDYVMRISPLSVNGNTVRTTIHPAPTAGDLSSAELSPLTSFVRLQNEATTWGEKDDSLVVSRTSFPDHDLIIIRGKATRTRTIDVSVSDPTTYWLTLFGERLSEYGVTTLIDRSGGRIPEGMSPLSSHSIPIDSAIVTMMKQSDNLTAEVLFRLTGQVHTGRPGSTPGATDAIMHSLDRLGVDTASVLVADGSGVSRYNLVSASVLVRLLEGVYERDDLRELFRFSLPVAGRDGTLKSRMKGTLAEGNLRGKTGTASGVSALSGYVLTAENELLCYSILMGQYRTEAGPYRMVQDAIGALLASMRRGDF